MSDPLRTDGSEAHDDDAKIEQLLIAGLDHYFAAQYERAIDVWTRALFLDRTHARTRAYIERARSALAERQRESEELLHHGRDAFQRGDADEARRLLQAAIDGGAPPDEALALLDRLNRLEPPPTPAPPPPRKLRMPSLGAVAASRAFGGRFRLVSLSVVAVAAGAYLLTVGTRIDWWWALGLQDPPVVRNAAPLTRELSLPLPRRGEMALERARGLAAGGRLRDALASLDAVKPTDPQRGDADRLRADIQRQLLALTPMPPPSAEREKGDRRQP